MSKPPRNPERGLKFGEGWWFERGGKYVARWHDGLKLRGKTFATIDEAEDHIRGKARLRRSGRATAASDLTVTETIADYLERATDRLEQRTVLNYRQRSARMIEPYLGSRRIVDLTTLDVQRWIDRLNREGYKATTVHSVVAVLFSALREATTFGIIPVNPANGIRRPSITREPVQVWSEDEARTFLAHVAGDPLYGTLYHVALTTGMRPGELRALQWREVDLERGIITVRRTITRNLDGEEVIGRETKTHRVRAIAITSPIVEMLRSHRTAQIERRLAAEMWQDHDLVFDRGDGHWLYQSNWQRAQVVFCREAGVPYVTAHGLRHTAATLLMESGIHPKIVSDILGHSSIEMTLNQYSHVSVDLQRLSVESFSDRLFGDRENA